ncbi:MAG: diphthine--ammonia ligase [Dethiobacteria bacterium]|jgi:diphthine-ammonia ligase
MEGKAGEKVFVSWSGGKDAYLALLKAREQGLHVYTLATFISTGGESMSHALHPGLLQEQAAALGLPLEMERVTWESYEEGFMRLAGRLRGKGIRGGVFGDINLPQHREWVEQACGRAALTAYLPLWGMGEKEVLAELLSRGVRLIVVSLRDDLLEEKWLGKEIDDEFCEMCMRKGISPCGENGEYHTLVVDGPLFKSPVHFSNGGTFKEKNHLFLKIKPANP